MDSRESWEAVVARERSRYEDGMARGGPEHAVRVGNAAYGAGLASLMLGRGEEAEAWLVRAASAGARAGAGTPTSWGRPIGSIKAALIAGRDADAAARRVGDRARHDPGRIADRALRGGARPARPRPRSRRRHDRLDAAGPDDFPAPVAVRSRGSRRRRRRLRRGGRGRCWRRSRPGRGTSRTCRSPTR